MRNRKGCLVEKRKYRESIHHRNKGGNVMSRVLTITTMALLALAVCVVMVSCAAPSPKELKPVGVKLFMVSTLFSGAESVPLETALEISNPNNFEIRLDSFDYLLYANGTKLAGQQYANDIFIPAGAKVMVRCALPVAFASLVGDKSVSEGMPAPKATAAVLPLWKAIGGRLPAAALQEIWDKAPLRGYF